jgi:phage tail-like protein
VTAVPERTWVVEGRAWSDPARATLDSTLQIDPDRADALTLGALPGRARALEDPAGLTRRWDSPAAIAGDPSAALFVVDAGAHVVRRVTLESSDAGRIVRAATVPTVGGAGHGHRRMQHPRGVAVLRSGAIAVADTGNHRVQVFSARPYVLLHVWGATDSLGRPAPGAEPLQFREPSAIAAGSDGTLYVADRGNRRVQRIRPDGVALEALGESALHDPLRMAVGPDRAVAVVDGAQQSIWIFTRRRALPQVLTGIVTPRSVAFAPDGRLYVGDANGRIHLFTPGPGAAEPWQLTGSGVAGFDGSIEDLLWWSAKPPRLLLLALEGPDPGRRRLWSVDPNGGRALAGAVTIGPLDSAIERCQWHRTRVEATVPPGGSIEVESFTAEREDIDPSPADDAFDGWTKCVLAGEDNPDCLIQSGPGRHLWLRLSLRSNGQSAPAIRRIRTAYPRTSYLEYLPAVFQEDDESRRFLERFLTIFKSGFDDFDERLDRLHEVLDPELSPARHLPWLASLVALARDPEWPEVRLREQIGRAVVRYRRRGTPDGLREAIRVYTGTDATILEHFRLRRWAHLAEGMAGADLGGGAPLWSRDVYQRLQLSSYSQVGAFRLTGRPEPAVEPYEWGANQFTVFFLASPYRAGEVEGRVRDVVERDKPAHTEATVCPVFPRFRVGVQARVGVDTAVGTISHLVLNQLATLGYDTILGCSQEERTLCALGSGVRPVVGSTTRVP